MNFNIKAQATATEFPKDAKPLKINGSYIRDKFGRMIITTDDIYPESIQPTKIIKNANVIVTQGKQWLGDVMIGVKTTTLQYIAVGTGTTTPLSSDTDVEGAIGSRHLYSDRLRTYSTITVSAFYLAAENNGTWGNAGLFTLSTGGDMLCHSTFESAVDHTGALSHRVDFDVTIG